MRIATWAAPLSRDGPGLLLRDILSGKDGQVIAVQQVLHHVAPDVLVLTEFDFDLTGVAAAALATMLAADGLDYPYRFALPPNSGQPTGLDMDGNGYLGEARDAQGYGKFSGYGGLLILSRYPILSDQVVDFSGLLWRDIPGAQMPQRDGQPFPSDAAQAIQRLSTTAHWAVPIDAPGGPLTLLTFAATPPVFDGPEDANGLRNADEVRFWQLYLDGAFGPPGPAVVIAGNANLDPVDGDGIRGVMATLLADPPLQDPTPRSAGGRAAADQGQTGDPALDTADWPDGAPGNLRVSYVLPAATWNVTGAGVFWPAPDDPDAALLGSDGLLAGPHHLVWVDVSR